MKRTIITVSSLLLLGWQLNSNAATCKLKNVSKNIPGTVVSGYCNNNNDQVSCNRSISKRWTCRGFSGVYSSMALGQAVADTCGCKWAPPPPEDNDEAAKDSAIPGLTHPETEIDHDNYTDNDNDNDENRDILDYFNY